MSRVTPAESTVAARSFSRTQMALLLSVFAFLIALRLPGAWLNGRFLDEEATVFLAYAWNFGSLEAVFRPFAGYWNAAANLISWLLVRAIRADVISLELAPFVTMLIGLGTQLLAIGLLLTRQASWLQTRGRRLVACLLVALAPGVEEVYLNIVHIQFHLALCAGILLGLDTPRKRGERGLNAAILFLGPLCGPGAILLLPLFGLRALVDRDRGRWEQAGILAAGSAIQLLVFYTPGGARGLPLEPILLGASMFVRLAVMPVLGPLLGLIVGGESYKAMIAGNTLILPLLAMGGAISFGGLLVWSLKRRDDAVWLIAAALLVSVASLGLGAAGQSTDPVYFALLPLAGPRYNYIPLILTALGMLVLANRPAGKGRVVAATLIGLNLVAGTLFYRITVPIYAQGPAWPIEVAKWRADPDYQLRAWPAAVRADLSGRRFVCPAHAAPPGNPAHPRYCESGWMAPFYLKAPGSNALPFDPK